MQKMKLQRNPWKHDVRSKRFSHAKLFGTISVFPNSLNRPRRTPEDQTENTLRCAAYAGAMNGGYIYGKRIHPDFQAIEITKIQGVNVDQGGSDTNAAMKSQCIHDGGYLPYDTSIPNVQRDGVAVSGNPSNFSALTFSDAHNLGGEGFVRVDGGADIYDSICSALVMAYDPKTKRGAGVQAFSGWYDSFDANVIAGIGNLLGYHSYLFIDFDRANEDLILTNSYGPNRWDGGLQRMKKDVANELFKKWGTSIKILKPLTPEQIALAKQETPFGRVQRLIIQAWYNLTIYLIGLYGRTL